MKKMENMMKNLIRTSFIALAFTLIGTTDAKRMTPRTVPTKTVQVSKNEKQMFINTKKLKSASSPQEKVTAAEQLAADIKSNPNTRLILIEQELLAEIKKLENSIASKESYISYFDAEEVKEDKEVLELLYQDLADVQQQLKKAITSQPKAVSLLNYWSVRALIAAVGIAIADQLVTHGEGRKALMTGASEAGKKISSAASTAWDYVPSWRSTTTNISDAGTTLATGPWSQTASDVIASAKGVLISGALSGATGYVAVKIQNALSALEETQDNPSVTREELQQKINDLQKALNEYKAASQQ